MVGSARCADRTPRRGVPTSETGCLAWFCSRSSGVRDRRTPDYATRQWSPGKVLPLRLLGVGQTRYYFTTGRKLAAWAGIAPAFAPSKGAVLRLDDPANGGFHIRVCRSVFHCYDDSDE